MLLPLGKRSGKGPAMQFYVVPSPSSMIICLLLLWKTLHRETVRGRPIKMSIKVNTFKEVMSMHYAMRKKKGLYLYHAN